MECQTCKSENLVNIQGKCNDQFTAYLAICGTEYGPDYVHHGLGIGEGDYIEFTFCLKCGQIQGDFPKQV